MPQFTSFRTNPTAMSKQEKINSYNPNGLSTGNQLFGLPFNEAESDVVILPVPWEVTVSYRSGTSKAPRAILEASKQVDLFDPDFPDAWKQGIFLRKINKQLLKWGKELRTKAAAYLSGLDEGIDPDKDKPMYRLREHINTGCTGLKDWVYEEMRLIIQKNKLPGLLGGDHSTPLGFMEALAEVHPEYGILQIDAHCDLRNAYEGFTYSHASIMFNALKIGSVKKLVQVGIRDFCEEEMEMIQNSNGRIQTFFDSGIKRMMYEGNTWQHIVESIVSQLPPMVYISFDIDGLDPKLCPNTGTPVAGGLEFEQAAYLIWNVVQSGRKIIGFDLNEVAPGKTEWDANVGARMLYKLCNMMGLSHKLYNERSAGRSEESHKNDEEVFVRKRTVSEVEEDREMAD